MIFVKIFIRTGVAILPYSFVLLSPILFLFPVIIDFWVVFSILFMQRCLLRPLAEQRFLTKIVYLSNYPIKQYLRSFNLFLAFTINLWCAALLAIAILAMGKVTFHAAILALLLMNTILFACFTVGNSLELSDFSTIKNTILRKIAENFLLSLVVSVIFFSYLLISIFFTDHRLFILLGLLAISLFFWHTSLNKINQIKYFHYL